MLVNTAHISAHLHSSSYRQSHQHHPLALDPRLHYSGRQKDLGHTEGQNMGPRVHIQFFSYGEVVPGNAPVTIPILYSRNVRDLRGPPGRYKSMTGKDPELIEWFWSLPEHERAYQEALATIKGRVRSLPPNGPSEYAVVISCRVGVHRSVIFVSRLHREIKREGLVGAHYMHLNLRKGMEARGRVVEPGTMPNYLPSRLQAQSH